MTRILLSNDDGIGSFGLELLANELSSLGEVWVVAPDRERSAISQAISLNRPLRAREVRPRWFSVDGTPVDCVYLALAKLLPEEPDLVFSGVNFGANLGQDVFYSGTVAAAMEAAIQGIPGVAVSLDVLTVNEAEASLREAMAKAAAFGRRAAEVVLARSLPAHALLNINVPGEVSGPPKITRLGRRHYGKEVIERQDPRGKKYYWIGGARAEYADIPGSDCNALLEGRISITPLRLELSAEDLIPALEGWGF